MKSLWNRANGKPLGVVSLNDGGFYLGTTRRLVRVILAGVTVAVGRFSVAICLSLVMANIGCGAMFNPSSAVIPVHTTPPGARVYVDGLYVADSPGIVTLTTATSHSVDIDADGYERQNVRIESRPSAGFIVLDCILLLFFVVPGIIALVVDGATGNWKVLDTNGFSVKLNPSRSPQQQYPYPAHTNQWRGPPAAVPTVVPSGPAGCQYDAQCKGDRICQAGQCVAPKAGDIPEGGGGAPPTKTPSRVEPAREPEVAPKPAPAPKKPPPNWQDPFDPAAK